MPSKNISLQSALRKGAEELLKAKIDSAWIDAELLLAFVLGKNRGYVLAHDTVLKALQYKKLLKLINKRKKFIPLAYLLGHKEFYGLDFIVTKDTLVPRPESELIIEQALPLLNKKTVLLDIGTGSGCLIISLLKSSKIKPKKSFALDISAKALAIAKKNAKKHGLKNISFKKSNLLSNISLDNTQYLIIANLPYVSGVLMKEKSIQKEPRRALYGGKDGLDYYRKLKKQLPNSYTLLCEINPQQKNTFKKIFPQARFIKDLAHKTRLALITK